MLLHPFNTSPLTCVSVLSVHETKGMYCNSLVKININIKLINEHDIHLMGHRGPRIGPVHPPVDQGDQEERAPKHQVSCCHYCVPVQNLLKVTRELNETFYRIYQKMELHFDSLNVLSFEVLPVVLHLESK